MFEHQILGAILPDNPDFLLTAQQRLEPKFFRTEDTRLLFTILERYWTIAGAVLPQETLQHLLSRYQVEPAKLLQYETLFTECVGMVVAEHEFLYALDALQDAYSENRTGEVLAEAAEILQVGWQDPKNPAVGVQKGHQAAREHLMERLSDLDRSLVMESAPEGSVKLVTEDILDEYYEAKAGSGLTGIKYGIPTLDTYTAGVNPGELCVPAAFTNAGKTQFVTQMAWHCAVKEGKNVFFATTETLYGQVLRRIVARHSREEKFGYPAGLDSNRILRGQLSEAEEEVFKAVLHDFKTNPGHGQVYVCQLPQDPTVAYMESRMRRVQQDWNIDLAIADYLGLFAATRTRQSTREEMNMVFKDAKGLARTFNSGKGVPLVSPWQVKQQAWEEALKTGHYALNSLSDTSEAVKAPDTVLTLLKDEASSDKEGWIQVIKQRDGSTVSRFSINMDYRSSYIGEGEVETSAESGKPAVSLEALFV
jgi:replicative DNA helicase